MSKYSTKFKRNVLKAYHKRGDKSINEITSKFAISNYFLYKWLKEEEDCQQKGDNTIKFKLKEILTLYLKEMQQLKKLEKRVEYLREKLYKEAV